MDGRFPDLKKKPWSSGEFAHFEWIVRQAVVFFLRLIKHSAQFDDGSGVAVSVTGYFSVRTFAMVNK